MSHQAVIDWTRFTQARRQLGERFLRQLSYLREDGARSVSAIEQAMRDRNAVGLIGPADVLKINALEMGAQSLAELAEDIEFAARDCIEWHQEPDTLIEPVLQLRGMFDNTVAQIEQYINPLLQRRVG